MEKDLKFLKEITEINGIPGNEVAVREFMEKELNGYVDEVQYDNIGSYIGVKKGSDNGPKVVIAGHMDEVGFMVTKITDEGFIKFTTMGGWWSQVMLAQQVTITTRKNKEILGVIGSKPPHILGIEERKKPVDINTMFIDVGVKDKEEAEKLGIRVGDMITPYIEFRTMGNEKYLLGKAWDNRIGCAVAIEVAKNLKDEKHDNILYAVGTVQEEVGCRGATTVGNKINPDIAIAVDVGIADDIPGGKGEYGKMGEGVQVTLKDRTSIGHKTLREFVEDIAEELEIPIQYQVLAGGGTDAGPLHISHDGAPSLSISIPSRYIHSHTSMIHRDDYENTVKLLTELVKRLNAKNVDAIKKNVKN